jgi:hypothetical protein
MLSKSVIFVCDSVWVWVCVTEPQTLIEVIRNNLIPEIQRFSMGDHNGLIRRFIPEICVVHLFFFLTQVWKCVARLCFLLVRVGKQLFRKSM